MKARGSFRIVIDKLFGTWDRRYAFFGIVVGILSPIASFLILEYPKGIPPFLIIRDVAFLLVLTIIIVILSYENTKKDILYKNASDQKKDEITKQEKFLSDLKGSFASLLAHANDMAQRATQELFHHYRDAFLERSDIIATAEEFKVFEKICLSITSHVRESLITRFKTLDINIEEDISVSVKLIFPLDSLKSLYKQFAHTPKDVLQKDLRVITAYRDNKTWDDNKTSGNRETATSLYTIEGNTAFDTIINKHKDRFVENDLSKLEKAGHYDNENPNWLKHYNSTLVVPIVLQESVNVPKEECRYLGFLAVDSLNPEGKISYDDEECYHILNHAAITLSNYFMVLILYHD